ncbi:hydantoinase B/oxoprolinase family protein [Neobacillus sp. 179-J 1A1 HS]|uniref:hydantoinase B/oxoprolinase family protein n=1 Tax=Neobacillus driksii TaxID=3035913 RepID=UPI0035BC0423
MDAITLEVMRNRLFAITEEAGAALIRTAYSTNIKDRLDCSCALFTVEGDTIAQAEHIPIHLGVLPWGIKGALKYIDIDKLQPGDAIIHNDPYIGGTHLPDLIIFSPIFYNKRLVAFVGNLAHHIDIGGKVPGSLSPDATEIFHEGLRFPPVKIRKAGVLDQEILAIHQMNIRTPYESHGDLMAQLASNNVGEKRFIELCNEFSLDVVLEAIDELDKYCARRMNAELAKLPAGSFEFSDTLDNDGLSDEQLTIKVKITTGGGKFKVDFTGTCPQTKGPLNAVRPMTISCIYYVLRAITDPTIPPNVGTFRNIEVITPEGSLVNAQFPAPTGSGNSITCQRIVDTLLGALAQIVPHKVGAAATGSMNGVQLGGFNPETRSYFTHGETYGGGYGGSERFDGTSGVNTHMTNTRNAPVEVLETIMPVRVERYGFVQDSEGAGLHRGGFGITRVMTILADDVDCFIASDRMVNTPWGLAGGKSARGPRFKVERPEGVEELPSKSRVRLKHSERLVIETSGGGGWGDPKKRKSSEIVKDVRDGLISPERANKEYGVLVNKKGKLL